MFKLMVLFGLLAISAAKPGLIQGISVPVAVAAPVIAAPQVIVPTAVSQQSRHDIINPGVITYTTAHVAPVIAAAPIVAAAPAVRVSSAATARLDVRGPVAAVATAPIAVGVGNAGGLTGGSSGLAGGLGGLAGGLGGLAGGYGLSGFGFAGNSNLGGGYGYRK